MGLQIKGLQNTIGISIAHPVFQRTRPHDDTDKHEGWAFRK